MPARQGPRPQISTYDILRAIDRHGPRWTGEFARQEITLVNEALDREILAGRLLDATTLTERGRLELERLRGAEHEGAIHLRIDHGCEAHDVCWTLSCSRCVADIATHVPEDELEQLTQKVVADHRCPGPTSAD